MIISETASRALYDAVAQSGKHKGLLKSKCPPSHTLGAAAWTAAQLHCNPYKVSISAVMFFDDAQREVYREIDTIFEKLGIKRLDRDRNALERMGAW